jgi:hypothetical protein
MKTVISLVAAVVLALSTAPATAGDMFQALSTIPADERARLSPLTDDQLAAIEGENILVLIRLLLAITPENVATLTSQILSYIESQLNIKLTPFVERNVKEVIQLNIGPTPDAQSNVVEVTQQWGNTGSFTRQGMWQGFVKGTQTHHPWVPDRR